MSAALAALCRGHAVTLQWIPSHCNVSGNEAAESLAKEGTTKEQVDRSTSYPEVKTILKAKQHSKWRHKHPWCNKADPYYLLTRREQMTVLRLRIGHNRLNYHLYSKLRIGYTEQCPCGTSSQTTEHRSAAVLPHLRATQKGNLVRPHSRGPQALRKPERPAMHCHLH